MALKAKDDSQDDIPAEAIALELYEERDGAWILKRDAIEGVKTQADVDRVQKALTDERKKYKDAKAKIDKLGDRDLDELLKLEDENAELKARVEAGAGKESDEAATQKRIDAAVATQVNPLKRELEKVTGERDTLKSTAEELTSTIRKGKIEATLRSQAEKAGVVPHAIDDIVMIGERIFELDDEGRIITRDNVGTTPGIEPETWFSEQKDKRPHWWPASQGGGATGNKGGGGLANNPFSSKHWNKTAQYSLDPAKADQYAKAAGFSDLAAAQAATKPVESEK